MSDLTIGELSRKTGVRTSALRFYETAGVLPAPLRAGRHRRYDTRAVRMVEVLRFAQDAGFTLQEIKQLFRRFDGRASFGASWKALAARKLQQLDELELRVKGMRAAIEEGLRCGCMRLEDCSLPPPSKRSTLRSDRMRRTK